MFKFYLKSNDVHNITASTHSLDLLHVIVLVKLYQALFLLKYTVLGYA